MAVVKKNEDSLVNSKMVDDKLKTGPRPKDDSLTVETKKRGFIRTTIEEVKKVEWPSFSYVLNWTLVIILFTAVFSVSLGVVDNVFNSGLKFVDCTSIITQAEGDTDTSNVLGDCSRDFLSDVTYRS